MRFLHAADIHLDSPLRGLRARAGEQGHEIADAPRRAFVKLIDFAIEQQVDLLLLAGDNWDGGHSDYGSLLFFAEEMTRLNRRGIRVAMIQGNHDAENQLRLTMPENVRMMPTRGPRSEVYGDLGVAVHGQSYPRRDVMENLAAKYPAAKSGMMNIGLLHTAVTGYAGAHRPYAPCTIDDLRDKSYDYWALGHVHARTELSRDPWIVYPGNLQTRMMPEAGEKGATLVTVRDGRVEEVEHVPLDVVRWVSVDVDMSGCTTQDGLAGLLNESLQDAVRAADGRLIVARVQLSGATELHHALKTNADHWLDTEIERARLDLDKLWLEQVIVETRAAGERGRAESDALAEIERTIEALRSSPQERDSLRAQIGEVVEKLVPSLSELVGQGPDGEAIDPDALLDSVLDDARDLLVGQLGGMS
jgi:DNA repair exonuclease SbcCD nuclease subunit